MPWWNLLPFSVHGPGDIRSVLTEVMADLGHLSEELHKFAFEIVFAQLKNYLVDMSTMEVKNGFCDTIFTRLECRSPGWCGGFELGMWTADLRYDVSWTGIMKVEACSFNSCILILKVINLTVCLAWESPDSWLKLFIFLFYLPSKEAQQLRCMLHAGGSAQGHRFSALTGVSAGHASTLRH